MTVVTDALGREIKVGDTAVVLRRFYDSRLGCFWSQALVRVCRITIRQEARASRSWYSLRIYYEGEGRASGCVTSGRRLLVVGPGLGLA